MKDIKLKLWLFLSISSFILCFVLCSVLVIKAAQRDSVIKETKKEVSENTVKKNKSKDKNKEGKKIKADKNNKAQPTKDKKQEIEGNGLNSEIEEKFEDKEAQITELADKWFNSLTLEQKVAGLFITSPNDLTGVNTIVAGNKTRVAINNCPVGGFLLNDTNFQNPTQLIKLTEGIKKIASELNLPPLILCIDEEGGKVLRIGDHPNFPEKATVDMFSLVKEAKQTKNQKLLYQTGAYIGGYLKKYGLTMDLAPVVDVWTNPKNVVIGNRAFSNNANEVDKYASDFAKGLEDSGVGYVLKHFPGHGDTKEDSHTGKAFSYKTKAELYKQELIPYKKAIERGVEVIMISHVTLPKIDKKPASLSYKLVTEILKNEMGYENLIMTDSLGMQAAIGGLGVNRVAVEAIKAGNDILLVNANVKQMQASVIAAVKKGEITEDRINESIKKILRYKASHELR